MPSLKHPVVYKGQKVSPRAFLKLEKAKFETDQEYVVRLKLLMETIKQIHDNVIVKNATSTSQMVRNLVIKLRGTFNVALPENYPYSSACTELLYVNRGFKGIDGEFTGFSGKVRLMEPDERLEFAKKVYALTGYDMADYDDSGLFKKIDRV